MKPKQPGFLRRAKTRFDMRHFLHYHALSSTLYPVDYRHAHLYPHTPHWHDFDQPCLLHGCEGFPPHRVHTIALDKPVKTM